MFDHCKLHNLDFLGNVLKMFELKSEKKMLTLGNLTVQYNRFWTGSECYFMFIFILCTFLFPLYNLIYNIIVL